MDWTVQNKGDSTNIKLTVPQVILLLYMLPGID